jgi:hypothetical protein
MEQTTFADLELPTNPYRITRENWLIRKNKSFFREVRKKFAFVHNL